MVNIVLLDSHISKTFKVSLSHATLSLLSPPLITYTGGRVFGPKSCLV